MKFRKSKIGIADSESAQNNDKKSNKQTCGKGKKKKIKTDSTTSESFESSTSITCFMAGLLWILKLLRLRKKTKVSPLKTEVEPNINSMPNSEEVLLDNNIVRSLSSTDIEDILATEKIHPNTIQQLTEISRTSSENLKVSVPKSANLLQPSTEVNERDSFVLQGRMTGDRRFRLSVRSSASNIERLARSRAAKSFVTVTFLSDMFDADQLTNNVKSIAVHYYISSQDLVYLHATFVDLRSEALVIFPPDFEFEELERDILEYCPVPRLDFTKLEDTDDDSETTSPNSNSTIDICFIDRQVEKQRLRYPEVPKLDLSQLSSDDESSDSESVMSSRIKEIPRLSDLCLSVINKLVANYETNTFDSTNSSKLSSPTVNRDMKTTFKPMSPLMAPRAPKEKSALDDITPFAHTSHQISVDTTCRLKVKRENSALKTSKSIIEQNKIERSTVEVLLDSHTDEKSLKSSNTDTNSKKHDRAKQDGDSDSKLSSLFQHDSPTKEPHDSNLEPQVLESKKNEIQTRDILASEETIEIAQYRSAKSPVSASSCTQMQIQNEEEKFGKSLSQPKPLKDSTESSNKKAMEKQENIHKKVKFNDIPDVLEFKTSEYINDGNKDVKNPDKKYASNIYEYGDRRRGSKIDEHMNNKSIEQYSPEVQKFIRKGCNIPEKPKPRVIGMPIKRSKVKFDNRIEVLRPEMPNYSCRSTNRSYKYFETVDEKEEEINEEIVGEGNDHFETDQAENYLLDLASCDNRVLRVKKHQIGGHIYPRTQDELDAREKLKKEKIKNDLAERRKRHILLDNEEEEDIEQYYIHEGELSE